MIWQVGEAGTNQAKERISGEMLASLRGNDRHGNPRLENLKSFQGEGYCRIDVYEKATGISRWLLGFVALRELLHRYHHLWTLQGPTQVVNRLVRCPDASCASRGCTCSPEAASSISMPRWCLGWEVLCWLGHRRFARHWSVPQLRAKLQDTHQIRLSDNAIEHYICLYQTMLAARQQDPAQLVEAYRDISSLVLTIDGLQPEKGHETLCVVRELMSKR